MDRMGWQFGQGWPDFSRLSRGDAVKIKDGTFESFEGSIDDIDEENGRITVLIEIFGRSSPVELEYWQVEKV